MSYYQQCAIPKPEPRKRVKARRKRAESAVEASVRVIVANRDGYCRAQARLGMGTCEGPSEFAHLEDKRRCFTRGMAPERRHTTAGAAMLCHYHHREYDGHRLGIIFCTPRGADGYVVWRWV